MRRAVSCPITLCSKVICHGDSRFEEARATMAAIALAARDPGGGGGYGRLDLPAAARRIPRGRWRRRWRAARRTSCGGRWPSTRVDAEDAHGFTALDAAARTGRIEAIRELVRAGADPNGRDHGPTAGCRSSTPCTRGSSGRSAPCWRPGPIRDGRSDAGLTPLMLAAAQSEAEIVDALLAAGADPRLAQAERPDGADLRRDLRGRAGDPRPAAEGAGPPPRAHPGAAGWPASSPSLRGQSRPAGGAPAPAVAAGGGR